MEHEVVLESGWPSVVLHFVAVKFKSGNCWWCELTGRLIDCHLGATYVGRIVEL